MAAARQAKVPLLFLYADSDPWVPVGESVKRVQSLAREMPNIEYAVVSNANHEMMFPGNEQMQVDPETTRNEAPQAPAYFMFLASWLTRHLAKFAANSSWTLSSSRSRGSYRLCVIPRGMTCNPRSPK